MSYVVQAIYEDGVLKPLERLALGEHQRVQVVVEAEEAVGAEGTAGPARTAVAINVPITTLAPDPFELTRDIPVVVQPADDGYIATFYDANISMCGDTKEESVANLRLLLVDVFDELEKEEAQLGPALVRQLAVLRRFIRRQT